MFGSVALTAQTMRLALISIAACALCACAGGINGPKNAALADTRSEPECVDVTRLGPGQLYGTWQVQFPPSPPNGTLTLSAHPEFAASLRGHLLYDGVRAIASGDIEGGELNLDESRDGKTLFAFWTGRLTPSACGAEIAGRWQPAPQDGEPAAPERPFILRRQTSR